MIETNDVKEVKEIKNVKVGTVVGRLENLNFRAVKVDPTEQVRDDSGFLERDPCRSGYNRVMDGYGNKWELKTTDKVLVLGILEDYIGGE